MSYCSIMVQLDTCDCNLTAVSALLDADNGVVIYTRSNFLRFDALSKGDNKDIVEGLVDGSEKVETPQTWAGFPSWENYDTLLEGDGLEIMAYAIYHFAACVVLKSYLPPLDQWGKIPLRRWLTVDDIAFILGTLDSPFPLFP